MDSIGERWKEFNGQDHWKNLLKPVDINLRRTILHYGDMAQAAYDAFKLRGPCPSEKDFSKIRGVEGKYEVTEFICATFKKFVKVRESLWIGYVAVATTEAKVMLGRRDIVIAWRGTQEIMDWFKNIDVRHKPCSKIFGGNNDKIDHGLNPKVHRGWLSVYMSNNRRISLSSARDQVLKEVRRLVGKYKDEEISITVTGHSLGAALATLNAADIVANGFNKPRSNPNNGCLVTAFVFASPCIGNSDFGKAFSGLEKENLRLLHIRNGYDPVPYLPPCLDHAHVGIELLFFTPKLQDLHCPMLIVTNTHLDEQDFHRGSLTPPLTVPLCSLSMAFLLALMTNEICEDFNGASGNEREGNGFEIKQFLHRN